MNKEQLQNTLEAYYKAETNLQEESSLRNEIDDSFGFPEESDVFAYYQQKAFVPENLENELFKNIEAKEKSRKLFRHRLMQFVSAAAVLVLFLSIFVTQPKNKQTYNLTQEEQFSVLEQALAQVSSGLQPPENDEVLVIFQDKNIEVVMN